MLHCITLQVVIIGTHLKRNGNMNNLDKQYQELLKTILEYGTDKEDRTGTGTKSIFGYTIRHNMQEGFPLLTTKKMYWKGITTELMWFLLGDTNIKYLVDNGCNIWNGDAFTNYISKTNEYKGNWPDTIEEFVERIKTDDEFARKWGELGPIYGAQWRHWKIEEDTSYEGKYVWVDQIKNLINEIKTNPDSRRLMVNAWNVGELDQMTLPPCHYGFQVYTRELSMEERIEISTFWHKDEVRKQLEDSTTGTTEKYVLDKLEKQGIPTRAISLMWNQRSVDTFLGLPFNIASYGLLLEMISKEVNMIPDQLIGNLGDVHLYNNHIDQTKELLKREPKALPTLKILTVHNFKAAIEYRKDDIHLDEFVLLGYDAHPAIKAPLSN